MVPKSNTAIACTKPSGRPRAV